MRSCDNDPSVNSLFLNIMNVGGRDRHRQKASRPIGQDVRPSRADVGTADDYGRATNQRATPPWCEQVPVRWRLKL
jgi:hypothetical protein